MTWAAWVAMLALAPMQDANIDSRIARAAEVFAAEGFKATGWTHSAMLEQNGVAALTLRLERGRSYQVYGACNDCRDIDLQLLDPAGQEVDVDGQEDDAPFVSAPSATSGSYTLRVRMTACRQAACRYGVALFVK